MESEEVENSFAYSSARKTICTTESNPLDSFSEDFCSSTTNCVYRQDNYWFEAVLNSKCSTTGIKCYGATSKGSKYTSWGFDLCTRGLRCSQDSTEARDE